MAKVNIDVKVTYMVNLELNVKDEITEVFVDKVREQIDVFSPRDDKESTVAHWIADNISENDSYDCMATIESLSINGEEY